MRITVLLVSLSIILSSCNSGKNEQSRVKRQTVVSLEGEKILINAEPTLKNISWKGISMEGLLPNARMVQGIFDDLNPETRDEWNYPDTKTWDPERNTDEFVKAMPLWREHGLLGFTINLQGGSPYGYSNKRPWYNSAIDSAGNLREDFMTRLEKIMDKSDELGMVTILGIFYFGQDERLADEEAIRNAVRSTIDWLIEKQYTNVLIEVANECNNRAYQQELIKDERMDELISLAQDYSTEKGYKYPVSASFNGNTLPSDNVLEAADFVLIHGNGVNKPGRIYEMVSLLRENPLYKPKPIIFNEDDHFDFEKDTCNMTEAFRAGASWGYFDFRMEGEGFEAGYQSVPVDWGINHPRKKAFFAKLDEMTGGTSGLVDY